MAEIKETTSSVVKASDVIGVEVQSTASEKLGKIEDIVLDKLTGTVRFVVLSFGGFLGIGDKLFALPWNSISYDAEEEAFILNIDKSKLKNAPGFDKDHWPDMADTTFRTQIFTYYGTKPYWKE